MSRELIERAARLISNERHWLQGALACDAKGQPCDPWRAKRFDAIGAVYHVARVKLDSAKPARGKIDPLGSALACLQMAAQVKHRMSMELVNDRIGHAAVMECMRLAWQRAPVLGEEDEDEDS